eukprot:417164-Rhodomonas_salina.1
MGRCLSQTGTEDCLRVRTVVPGYAERDIWTFVCGRGAAITLPPPATLRRASACLATALCFLLSWVFS